MGRKRITKNPAFRRDACGVYTFSGLKAWRITAQGKAFTPPPWVLEYGYNRPERVR